MNKIFAAIKSGYLSYFDGDKLWDSVEFVTEFAVFAVFSVVSVASGACVGVIVWAYLKA